MKKIGKIKRTSLNTVEAYACVCSCSYICVCICDPGLAATPSATNKNTDNNNTFTTSKFS